MWLMARCGGVLASAALFVAAFSVQPGKSKMQRVAELQSGAARDQCAICGDKAELVREQTSASKTLASKQPVLLGAKRPKSRLNCCRWHLTKAQ